MHSSSNGKVLLTSVLALLTRERDTGAHAAPLKEARIRIHHNLVAMLCGRLIQSSQSWQVYREVSAAALGGIEAPLRQVVACVRRHY